MCKHVLLVELIFGQAEIGSNLNSVNCSKALMEFGENFLIKREQYYPKHIKSDKRDLSLLSNIL